MAIDRAIMVQTAGKIAGELVASMHLRTTGDIMESFNEVFSRVMIAMEATVSPKEENTKKSKGGRQVPIISQEEIQMRLNQKLQSGSAVTSNLVQF